MEDHTNKKRISLYKLLSNVKKIADGVQLLVEPIMDSVQQLQDWSKNLTESVVDKKFSRRLSSGKSNEKIALVAANVGKNRSVI